jgi:hypothetical protein
MQIREGAYYRTRGGDVMGPMAAVSGCDDTFTAIGYTWNEDGSFVRGNPYKLDLISEVYVSDTPPAVTETEDKWRERLLAAGPNWPLIETHDRKTLRDEFAMEAMKLLIPRHERREETLAEFAYRQADAMMEARKK